LADLQKKEAQEKVLTEELIKYPKEFAFYEEKKRKSFKNMRG